MLSLHEQSTYLPSMVVKDIEGLWDSDHGSKLPLSFCELIRPPAMDINMVSSQLPEYPLVTKSFLLGLPSYDIWMQWNALYPGSYWLNLTYAVFYIRHRVEARSSKSPSMISGFPSLFPFCLLCLAFSWPHLVTDMSQPCFDLLNIILLFLNWLGCLVSLSFFDPWLLTWLQSLIQFPNLLNSLSFVRPTSLVPLQLLPAACLWLHFIDKHDHHLLQPVSDRLKNIKSLLDQTQCSTSNDLHQH